MKITQPVRFFPSKCKMRLLFFSVQTDPNLWRKFLLTFNIDPLEFVKKYQDDLFSMVEGENLISEVIMRRFWSHCK